MRNLKKILALVLALMMVIGLMATASAVTPGTGYEDDATISSKYDEAVQVLSGIGVFRGTEDGSTFSPEAAITRAEVAAIVYRIVTGDIGDKQVGIYADYNQFSDVPSTAWYAGYVNYCAIGEYIQGDGAGHFYPMEKVNGYQVLAIILRAIGYGKEGEYTGTAWQINTASDAKELGITENIATVETVDYTLLRGYRGNGSTVGYDMFDLTGTSEPEDIDDITDRSHVAEIEYDGTPYYTWYADVYGGEINCYLNPVATYTTTVTGATLWAAAGLTPYASVGIDASYEIDGDPQDDVELYSKSAYYGNDDIYYFGGNGIVTNLYVLEDDTAHVTETNTYIGMITTAYKNYAVYLDGEKLDDDYGLTSGIAKYTYVLYNEYDEYGVEVASIHAADSKTVSVGATKDTGYVSNSYFKAGNKTYYYDANYETTREEAYGILDETDEGLGSSLVVYLDDYGYAIMVTDPTYYATTGAFVITAADVSSRVSVGKYVLELDVVMVDGDKKTVKALSALDLDDDTYDDLAAPTDYTSVEDVAASLIENGSVLVSYAIDANGYYVITGVGAELDLAEGYEAIVRGDANCIDDINVDGTTTFLVENYKSAGTAIKGYSDYKGIKAVPTLEDADYDYAYGITYVQLVDETYVIYVTGAKSVNTTVTTEVPNYVYLLDTVPEKVYDEDDEDIVYWVYDVVQNGKVTTLKSVTDPTEIDGEGLYFIDRVTSGSGKVYSLTEIDDQDYTVVEYGYAYDIIYTDDIKLTVADDCDVYLISGASLVEAELADLVAEGYETEIVVLYDKYGYVETIFILDYSEVEEA